MTDFSHFSAVILAAGMSSRMNAFKPLLTLGDETVIEKAVSTFEGLGIKDIIVVTGHRMEALAPALGGKPVRLVENPDYQSGMFGS